MILFLEMYGKEFRIMMSEVCFKYFTKIFLKGQMKKLWQYIDKYSIWTGIYTNSFTLFNFYVCLKIFIIKCFFK